MRSSSGGRVVTGIAGGAGEFGHVSIAGRGLALLGAVGLVLEGQGQRG